MTTLAMPTLTDEQRLEALAKANATRTARAQLKRAIRGGQIHITEILRDPSDAAMGMKVRDLLLAQKWRGPVAVQKLMNQLRISYGKTIGGLSMRQREELITAILRRPTKATA